MATTLGVVGAGQALGLLPFPANFGLLLAGCALAGVASFSVSRRIAITDQPMAPDEPRVATGARIRGFVRLIRGRATFLDYELRAFVFTAGIGISTPLLPLLYVNEIAAPNSWIGIIGAAQSVGGVAGYLVARRASRRRGGATVLLPSMLAAALVPAAMALLHDLPMVAALALLGGLATAGTQLGLFNELMKRVPREHGVTFSSVDQTLQNLGLIVAPSVGGLLAVTIGVRPGLAVAAAVATVGFGMFALDWRAGRRTTA